MAATLTDAGELTYASFPIDKVETDADGDLIVFGKASDGSIDSDQQIVDPSWMSHAAQAWKESGANLRVQHNAQRDPAGVGLEVETDANGATWVKGLVVEPIAKKLVAKGALRAYSVGIARPTITRDAAARGGRITDGELVEISLVDRPANKRCGIQLVKSADDGTPEYVNEVFGSDDDIAKALGADVTKAAGADDDFVNVDLPKGASISISPGDFAKLRTLKQELTVKAAIPAAEKRDVAAAERRSLAGEGNALPDGSYPIKNTGDLRNAAVLARSGHGDVAAARRLIARRAGELGVANPLDESDDATKGLGGGGGGEFSTSDLVVTVGKSETPAVQDEAVPDVAKDKPVKKAKKPKKLPPWLNKPKDDDGDDDDSSCKQDHAHTEKCKTTPAEAAGLSGTHDMHPAPVPDLQESPPMASTKGSPTPAAASGNGETQAMKPVPAHREPDGAIVEPFEKDAQLPAAGQGEKPTPLESGMMKSSPEVAALLRFKHAGIDPELGRLHDLTCPAYHPEDVAKCHPFADLHQIDVDAFQREAVKAACGPDMDRAKGLHKAWQAARVLREADPGVLNDYRLAAHKAFRDANPGPTSAPTPGVMSPGKFSLPLVTDGHSAPSSGHSGPNTSPQVATSAPDAHSFDRPPLASGHQSPSPSHMKASFEYPDGTGRPQQLNYAIMDKEKSRFALEQMHDQLSRQFPAVCPMDGADGRPLRGVQPENHPVPPIAGIGKSVTPEPAPAISTPVAAVFKAPAEDEGQFADAEVFKSFKKMRKKLGKKVLSGSMTVDEARAKLGRQFAQKAAEPEAGTAEKARRTPRSLPRCRMPKWSTTCTAAWTPPSSRPLSPRHFTHSPSRSRQPRSRPSTRRLPSRPPSPRRSLLSWRRSRRRTPSSLRSSASSTPSLISQTRPRPRSAAWLSTRFAKTARPAGVTTQAEIAERTQQMMIRSLQDKYNSSSDPHEREAYYDTLCKMRGIA